MRIPRDLSGSEIVSRLSQFEYEVTRQTGSHIRLTRSSAVSEHHVTIPMHKALRVGTLNAILKDVADHLKISKDELIRKFL